MTEYLVVWSINLDGEDPVDAARQALAIQRDPGNTATIFHVMANGVDEIWDVEDPDSPVLVRKEV